MRALAIGRQLSGLNRTRLCTFSGRAVVTMHTSAHGESTGCVHVLVVGGGLAGLTAALTAAEHGACVTLLEKERSVGGNSAKASSGMNGARTPAQVAAGIHDSPQLFYEDTLASGHGLTDAVLARVLAEGSAAAVEWLRVTSGLDLSAVVRLGGHRQPRTHHEPPRHDGKPSPIGWNVMSALKKVVEAKAGEGPGSITVRTGLRATELLQDCAAAAAAAAAESAASGSSSTAKGACAVIGVRAVSSDGEQHSLPADAVVLATGGFGHDAADLLARHAPSLAHLPTTNGAFASGDGVKMAAAAGAHLVHMEHVQVHPTGFVDPAAPGARVKFLAAEALRGRGGLLLNAAGRRFTDELGRRDDVTAAMFKSCRTDSSSSSSGGGDVTCYLVLGPLAADALGGNFQFYYHTKGFFKKADNLSALAAELGVPVDALKATFAAYTAAARGEAGDAWGKTTFPDPLFGAAEGEIPLYVARVTPSIHYTMGGVAFNTEAQLLYAATAAAEGAQPALLPVPRLYGAGEVTGGLHGANRLGGNSLLECVVFGRIAGKNAAGVVPSATTSAAAAAAATREGQGQAGVKTEL